MKKILVANRGEIALRIIRACRESGYQSVAIAAEPDAAALHARLADECHILPGSAPLETYLNQAAILEIARKSGADAVHPGYGLLSENDQFAAAVEAAGLTWIGPSASAIALLGDKVSARTIARDAGSPLLPSRDDGDLTVEKAREFVAEHGFPVIIKAQNGGGGRGMRIVRDMDQLAPMFDAAQREAGIAFGRAECFIERYAEGARHIETQCLADSHGTVLVLSTRDCTLQRRQQKLVEEAPAPFLSQAQLDRLTDASIAILQKAGYRGAATCEFLLTPDGELAFLEVNTRVQVEHPVTEQISGTDIIREMFRIAEGERLGAAPGLSGHSIEFRINAEDIHADFRPAPGQIQYMRLPSGPGIRLDFGYEAGDTVPPFYDSLLGKIIVTGKDRAEALIRARRALGEFAVLGIKTVVPLHLAFLDRPEFIADTPEAFAVHTRWVDAELPALLEVASRVPLAHGALSLSVGGAAGGADEPEGPTYRASVKAPLSGLVLKWLVEEGELIAPGDPVAIMESMKMEQTIESAVAGMVCFRKVAEGGFIDMDEDLLGVD